MAGLWITADSHRLLPQLRAPLAFYGGIKCVHVHMQNMPPHPLPLLTVSLVIIIEHKF